MRVVPKARDALVRRPDREAVLIGDTDPLGHRPVVKDRLELMSQRVVVATEVDRTGFGDSLDEIGPFDKLAESRPELRLDAAEQDIPIIGSLVELILRAGQ